MFFVCVCVCKYVCMCVLMCVCNWGTRNNEREGKDTKVNRRRGSNKSIWKIKSEWEIIWEEKRDYQAKVKEARGKESPGKHNNIRHCQFTTLIFKVHALLFMKFIIKNLLFKYKSNSNIQLIN